MNKILHVGFDLPNNEIYKLYEEDYGMPVQTIKFANSITTSLESCGFEVTLMSTQPSLNFPKNYNLLYGPQSFKKGDTRGFIIPFINLYIFKHVTRFFSILLYMSVFLKGSNNRSDIIIHGVHFPFIFAAYLVKKLFSVKVYVFVTDPPEVLVSNKIDYVLRCFNELVIYKLLNKMSGLIVLSEQLYIDKSFKPPYIVLDGFLDQNLNPKVQKNSETDKLKIGYAGLLNEAYGLKNLVLASINNENIELHLFGKGDCESFIKEVSQNYNNIIFHGFVSPDSLYDHLDDINIMINPRPVYHDFAKYSFPSKTIEYMAMGKLLITTQINSIGPEYKEYVVFINGDSVASISETLRLVSEFSRDEILYKAKLGMDFIWMTRTVNMQGIRIKDFMKRCGSV